MKNWLKKNGLAICNGCLAFAFFYHLSCFSGVLLGEPEFPNAD